MRSYLAMASVVMLCGCNRTPTDSGKLGTFDVVADMQDNSCGPQVASNQQGRYAVDLLVQDGSFKWRPVGGVEGIGEYDTRTGAFRVQIENDIVVQSPDPRREIVGCTLHRVDLVQGTLDLGRGDAGVPAQDAEAGVSPEVLHMNFRATSSVYFGATSGSNCVPLLGVGQGQVLALPCSYSYRLQGVAR